MILLKKLVHWRRITGDNSGTNGRYNTFESTRSKSWSLPQYQAIDVGLSTTCVCFHGRCNCGWWCVAFLRAGYCWLSLRLQFKWVIGKCVLNHKWLSDAKFSWVKEFKGDKHKAMCCVCNKATDIERMGESALKSHMKGEKHKRNAGASLTPAQSVLMTTFLHNWRT